MASSSGQTPDRVAAPAIAVPILTYHNIGEAPPGATHTGLYLGLDKFRRQLEVLAEQGWRGVSMDEGLPFLRGEKRGRVAVMTFDDGYRDNLELAMPALREHGFSATCYLVADRIGEFNAWDSELLRVRKPLMDLAGIRDWLAGGMRIGSHTLSHPHLSRIDRTQMQREVAASKSVLEDRLGIAVDHFCYPYGDHDAACVAAAAEAGYRTAVTIERGRVRPGQSLFALPRVGNNGRRSGAMFLARTLMWGLSGPR
jgi:peptidoglycan/xylan/chitin deacetylase (PgdA/CDA1 family)